ncbi:uncharacterized protein LOC121379350 [Gigantopelta aegis]|uniref:uncharacterized protein LOC121379350 n=1 Tax=Gigantopelta aegis TaxID=1735272 RepID=UPI001B88B89F|nr:uncharacterized protein LOC121379350 [Gigantopelta aegis]
MDDIIPSVLSGRQLNSTLLLQSLIVPDEPIAQRYIGLAILHILLGLWICLSNLSQVVTILMDRQLRRTPRNLLMVNVSVSELIIGVFSCPLYTDSLLHGMWRHSASACISYEAIFYLQAGISLLAVLMVSVERFYYILSPKMLEGSGNGIFSGILIFLPWGIGLSLILPMYMEGADVFNVRFEGDVCIILWKKQFQIVTCFTSFFGPSFLVLTMMVAVIVLFFIFSVTAKIRCVDMHFDDKSGKEALFAVCMSSCFSVCLPFPLYICLLMHLFCTQEECIASEAVWGAVMILAMIKSGVMPLVWLVYADVRQAYRSVLARRWRAPRHRSNSFMLYDEVSSQSTVMTQI